MLCVLVFINSDGIKRYILLLMRLDGYQMCTSYMCVLCTCVYMHIYVHGDMHVVDICTCVHNMVLIFLEVILARAPSVLHDKNQGHVL